MSKLYKNMNLIDGSSSNVLKDAWLLEEKGLIKQIGSGAFDGGLYNCEVIDLEGKFVMPGMIDCHVHFTSEPVVDIVKYLKSNCDVDYTITGVKSLEAYLRSGVVYIRDCGGINYCDLKLKTYARAGKILSPDIHVCGKIVTMTGGHAHLIGREADGIDEVRKAVREQLREGADFIKVMATAGGTTPEGEVDSYSYDVDELKEAVKEAHKAGKKIAAHCHGTQGIKNSIVAGIDSIEHASLLDDEAIDLLLEYDTYIVPTLSAPMNILANAESGIPEFVIKKTKILSELHKEGIYKAYKKGVKIAMGTDAGTPFNKAGDSAKELQYLVEAGLSPEDVIVIATKNSSELLGVDKMYGTLAVNKYANFIILSENPIDNIKTVQNPVNVCFKGNMVGQ